ncbi:hypothetical protein [Rhodococcus sp. H29-C3]|uniref:hypothetical protein n=1 Tax=Rhodococcus sp. H29-C3 TaxID=3046307 RepID=UPI0024BABF5B|nr:hypothetical protein [Rhodococcus sp. H29-C3]MDJ0363122.1 hypothetical protein [Rhodococcus sp. H29-C3]
MLIIAGILIVAGAGVGSIALREKSRPQLAKATFVLMIAGVLVLTVGTWMRFDDYRSPIEWFLNFAITAAALVTVVVGVRTLRTPHRRSAATDQEKLTA